MKRSWRLREGLCDLVVDLGPPAGDADVDAEDGLLHSFLVQVKSSTRGDAERVFVELYAELFGAPPPGWPFAGEDAGKRWAFFDSLEARLRDAMRRGWVRLRERSPRRVVMPLAAPEDDDALGPLSEAPDSEDDDASPDSDDAPPMSQSFDAASSFDMVEQDAQAAVLVAAAASGVPFCEECQRAAAARS